MRAVPLVTVVLLIVLFMACAPDPNFAPRSDLVAHGDFRPAETALRQPPDSLVVVSYNIQYGKNLGEALTDLERIAPDGADLYLLQEMTPTGTEHLAEHLGCEYVYFPASVHPHHDRLFGNAVLSRWPVLDRHLVVMPHTAPVTHLHRVAVGADLEIAGRTLRAISVHTATVVLELEERLDQVAAVIDTLVAPWDGPLVVGGDLNTTTDSGRKAIGRQLRDAGLRTVYLGGDTVRWNAAKLVGQGEVLDHIFVRGLEPGHGLVDTRATASDHFPVRADFGWPTTAP